MTRMIDKRKLFCGIFSGAAVLASPALAWTTDGYTAPLPSMVVDQKLDRHPTLASASNAPVGIQLVLALDTSASMSGEEFRIERRATAYALNSELVRNAIKYKGGEKSIAVCVMDFDDRAFMRIPWVDLRREHLNDKPYQPDKPGESSGAPDRLDSLAEEIGKLARRGNGGTNIVQAMDLSLRLFPRCPWECLERRVLDVCGDGPSAGNMYALARMRDKLAAAGVTVNGVAIVNESVKLDEYFRERMVTTDFIPGPDGLYSEPGRVWVVARNMRDANNQASELTAFFGDLPQTMKQKISIEVAGIDDYRRILARLDAAPAAPVPRPVEL